ncbi:MAG: DUF3597 domain-containing protein [Anaerolineaceae bacterium]|jgi:hypothetical protein|nr:DUF3597 domain-containing protein [Anaerolineaceae bacterium]OQY89503.1 MAG: hypothetical protein B6D38_06270 [Anaerolineae bacterium UTCFX1]
MGFFSKILGKLGMGKKEEDKPQFAGMSKPAGVVTGSAPASTPTVGSATPGGLARPAMAQAEGVHPEAMAMVDVVSKLDGLAKASAVKLDWKVSIVDLLKLLEIDSSFDARKELATELNCPAELMGDSAKMNTWLHKEVLKRIAANGGNVPKELLD